METECEIEEIMMENDEPTSNLDHPYAVMGFMCPDCHLLFTTKASLIYHKKQCTVNSMTEKETEDALQGINPSTSDGDDKTVIKCNVCGGVLKNKKTLRSHMLSKHNVDMGPTSTKQSRFKCVNCTATLWRADDLKKHYADSHSINLEVETFSFKSDEEFLFWKKEMEAESSSAFVKYSGDKRDKDKKAVKQVFNCHRSGKYISHGVGQRRIRRNGSIKINAHCPARIAVTKWIDGRIEVSHTKTHLGHDNEANERTLEEHRVLKQTKADLYKEIHEMIYQCNSMEELEEIKKVVDPVKTTITGMRRRRRRAELRNKYGSYPRNKRRIKKKGRNLEIDTL